MQIDTGIRAILSASRVYEAFQSITGDAKARRFVAKHIWQVGAGDKVVDIGCGPGTVLEYLDPAVEYVGFDVSEAYIKTARETYGDRGTFLVGHTNELAGDPRFSGATLVTCNGLLHHLDDPEAKDVIKFGRSVLAPGGKMVCVEPCFLAHQDMLSRWLISRDRGQNVRRLDAYRQLLRDQFDDVEVDVMTSILRIPYVHALLVGRVADQV